MNQESPDSSAVQLGQLSTFLTYQVSRLHGKLNAQASRILRDSVGVTLNQWRIIAFVGGAGQITASELIHYTALDKGLVSRNVKSLIEEGLVVSTPHDTDSRSHLLRLTEAGRAIYDVALPRMRKRQADLKKDISGEDIDAFRRVVAALERAAEDRA